MPYRQVDPSRLDGDALARWYGRSPDDVEQERQGRAAQRYDAFFGRVGGGDAETGFGTSAQTYGASPAGAFLDRRNAGPGDEGLLIEIGNPENRKLRRAHEEKYGYWPRTKDGRNYDVAHRKAVADGGTNTLDNIYPMHPDEHRSGHRDAGDNERWGKRSWIARAFGGRVEPPAHAPKRGGGPKVRGFGLFGLIPNITGILSGRTRTDNFDNFTADMMGWPSADDHRKATEQFQQQMNPKWKPGDPEVI